MGNMWGMKRAAEGGALEVEGSIYRKGAICGGCGRYTYRVKSSAPAGLAGGGLSSGRCRPWRSRLTSRRCAEHRPVDRFCI